MHEGDVLWLETLRITITWVGERTWRGKSASGRMFVGHLHNVKLSAGYVFSTCEWTTYLTRGGTE